MRSRTSEAVAILLITSSYSFMIDLIFATLAFSVSSMVLSVRVAKKLPRLNLTMLVYMVVGI